MITTADRRADSPDRANFGAPSHPPASRWPPKSHARKIEFREPVQADLGCPVPSRKIFRFCFSEICVFFSPSRLAKRGASRSSRTLGRDAVDAVSVGRDDIAGRSDRERCSKRARRTALMRTAKSCGPDTPTLVSSFVRSRASPTGRRCAIIHGATVAKKPGHRGERAISRKTIAWGMPDVFRCLRCEYWCAYSTHLAHTRLRVHWAPGIPRALCSARGENAV